MGSRKIGIRGWNAACAVLFFATAIPWQSAAAEDLLAGCWTGSWCSVTTGHEGKLSASFCRVDAQCVEATFRGTFHKILPFRYKATLRVVHEEPGLMVLSGSQRLGPLMGTFRYQATITDGQFQATYSARRDCGHWTMSR